MKKVSYQKVSTMTDVNNELNKIRDLLSEIPESISTPRQFAYLYMSVDQTSGLANGDIIKFDSIAESNMKVDKDFYRVQLKANITYFLYTACIASFSATLSQLQLRWWNLTTSEWIGQANVGLNVQYSGNYTQNTPGIAIYTPRSDVWVCIKMFNNDYVLVVNGNKAYSSAIVFSI